MCENFNGKIFNKNINYQNISERETKRIELIIKNPNPCKFIPKYYTDEQNIYEANYKTHFRGKL